MAPQQLQALQFERLKHSIGHASRNVAHYRRSFVEAGVDVDDLRTLEDLGRFPFTVKDDLRRSYPFGWLAVDRRDIVRTHASSGTTGTPTVVGYTAGDIDTWADLMARCLFSAGIRSGDILNNTHGYGLFTGGLGVHYGAERLGCTVVPVSGGNTEKQVQLIEDFAADAIVATPSYAVHIAEVAAAMGVDLSAGSLRNGMFGGEPWPEQMRGELETRLGLRAHDLYGLCEIMGPGVACECSAQYGLHGWEDHFLFETIDPDSGEPLPKGETGELVITTLTRQAMPVIRYRTRDITQLLEEPCDCGRTHVRIRKITGRSDDMLIIRGVNIYPSQMESALVDFGGLSPHYQLLIRREGALDSLTMEVELRPDNPARKHEVEQNLASHIKSRIGVTCNINIMECGRVPRSQGKAVRVHDLRKQ